MKNCRLYPFTGIVLAILLLAAFEPSLKAGDWEDILSNVPTKWRVDVGEVLELAAAEWNDGELITALQTYPPGSSKHRAVCFLIAHMEKHLYVDYVNPDDPLNPFSPENGSGEWHREYIPDYATMTAELLIENVEWAYRARETYSWCSSLPENVFFDYVLPYRSTQEPVHSWRPMLFEQLAPMVSGLRTSLEVADVINSHNTEIFGFDPLYYRHPEDRDIPTCLACGLGRCEDMSNISNYTLRALGVPATSDFTPRWPKGDNNHAWNAVYYKGIWYTFMGCEHRENPVYDTIKNRDFAKVYRKSYSADPIMGPAPDGTAPPRLMRVAAIDVTAEYSTVSDVHVRVNNPSRATFLCVHNFGTWRSVAGAWAIEDSVHFPDVGNHDILYCATRYIEDESGWGDHHPAATPFVLHRNGSIEYINPCPVTEPANDIVLTGWNDRSDLEVDQEVSLFRYVGVEATEDDEEIVSPMEWQFIGTIQAVDIDGTVTAEFPSTALEDGLYLLSDSEDPDSFRDGSRPFIWSEEGIVYY